jgi:maleylacetate reductase
MLPHVLDFNDPVLSEQQKAHVVAAFQQGGVGQRQPGPAVAHFIKQLGLPHTLENVGVTPDMYEDIGRLAMTDIWTLTNPTKIAGPDVIIDILKRAETSLQSKL